MPRNVNVIALVMLLAPGACALPGKEPQPGSEPPAWASLPAEHPARVARPVPNTAETDQPGKPNQPDVARPLPPKPPRRPAFPRVHASQLAGLSAEQALVLFGKPTHADRDDETTAWTYEAAGCRLHLRFRFSVAANALRASGYELSPETIPTAICLHTLARHAPRIAARPAN